MMKRAAIFAAAIALVLSLAACGNRDGKNDGSSNGNNSSNGTTNNSGTAGTAGNNGSTGSGGVTNSGDTGTTDNTRMNGNTTARSGGNNTANTGRSIGGDVRGAVDDMGRAVDDLLDVGNNSRTAGTTSFERMLDNARVHDVDGVLTDGENGRW